MGHLVSDNMEYLAGLLGIEPLTEEQAIYLSIVLFLVLFIVYFFGMKKENRSEKIE